MNNKQYLIYLVDVGYYRQEVFDSIEDAKQKACLSGLESVIYSTEKKSAFVRVERMAGVWGVHTGWY